MPIIHGKDVVLSCLDDGEYKKLGGLRVTDMALESNYARANAADDSEWDELSSTPISRSLRLLGDGIFYTENTECLFADFAYDGNQVHMQLSFNDAQTVVGKFAIERYSYQSNARTPLTFSLALKSSGEILFS